MTFAEFDEALRKIPAFPLCAGPGICYNTRHKRRTSNEGERQNMKKDTFANKTLRFTQDRKLAYSGEKRGKFKTYSKTAEYITKSKDEKLAERFGRFVRALNWLHPGEQVQLAAKTGRNPIKVRLGKFTNVGTVDGRPTVFVCNSDLYQQGFYRKTEMTRQIVRDILGVEARRRGERRDYGLSATQIAERVREKLG